MLAAVQLPALGLPVVIVWLLFARIAPRWAVPAAVLATATGDEAYWADYERAWSYALTHLVDLEHGGWFKTPALAGARTDRRKGDGLDPDYHPAGACFEALRCLALTTHPEGAAP